VSRRRRLRTAADRARSIVWPVVRFDSVVVGPGQEADGLRRRGDKLTQLATHLGRYLHNNRQQVQQTLSRAPLHYACHLAKSPVLPLPISAESFTTIAATVSRSVALLSNTATHRNIVTYTVVQNIYRVGYRRDAINNVNIFKQRLKTHLFEQSFG